MNFLINFPFFVLPLSVLSETNDPSVDVAKESPACSNDGICLDGTQPASRSKMLFKGEITGEGITPAASQGWARMAMDTDASFHPHLSSSHHTLPLCSPETSWDRVQEKQSEGGCACPACAGQAGAAQM